MEAFGAEGALSADNLTATAVRKAAADTTEAKSRIMDFFLDRYVDAYSRELNDFIEATIAGHPVSPSVKDGLAALLLAEAAGVSAKEGHTVQL